jgi:DNA-binding transcriptional ArsR family regulator
LSIIDILADNKELNVTELHEVLDIEQAVASHHLGILKDRGILISERRGKNTFYSLKFDSIFEIVTKIKDCCKN